MRHTSNVPSWGDNGDGTYNALILPADYSDPDPIRVGEDYYMVASSFMDAPGVPILHSRDLVNWEIISYAVPDTTVLSDDFSWRSMTGYGHGVYACSIRYHAGKYFVYIPVYPEGGLFVSTASDPRGPWTVEKIKDQYGQHVRHDGCRITDICPFWDTDGKQYLVISHLSGSFPYDMDDVGPANMGQPAYLFAMNEAGNQLIECDSTSKETIGNTGILIRNTHNTEGNKLYWHDGYYYFFNIDFVGRSSHGAGAYIRRSKYLFGSASEHELDTPYTDYPVTHHAGYYEKRFLGNDSCIPTQGGFVSTPDGRWFFIGQKNDGCAGGRRTWLVPVSCKDGWPILGIDQDGDGTADHSFLAGPKPVQDSTILPFQCSDHFDSTSLSPIWQWNHQPRETHWSLTDRPDCLRLYAYPTADGTDDLWKVGNVLHQRFIDTERVCITVKMDIAGMANGQTAGITHFNGGTSYAAFGVSRKASAFTLIYTEDGQESQEADLPSDIQTIWFKTTVKDHLAAFFFSLDSLHYQQIAQTYLVRWGKYRGDRIGVYTFNNCSEAGYVDVDTFEYQWTK